MNEVISMDGFDFKYKIKSVDVEHGTMIIEYDPVDTELMPMTLNVMLWERPIQTYPEGTYIHPDDVPFEDHFEHTVRSGAPIASWRRHRLLAANMEHIVSKM